MKGEGLTEKFSGTQDKHHYYTIRLNIALRCQACVAQIGQGLGVMILLFHTLMVCIVVAFLGMQNNKNKPKKRVFGFVFTFLDY